jgi:DNA invertase Pin-like site-specific DNA recombinase
MQFDMATPQGKLMVTMLAGISEFERGLLRERIKSGIAHAKAQGKKLGRQAGQNPSDKYAKQVLKHIAQGRSYRWIAHEMQISKTTVLNIAKRAS